MRVGDTVRRPAGAQTPAVQALLGHLRRQGFQGAPVPLGVDERGREVVSFVAGEVPATPLPAWLATDDVLAGVARLARRFHDAAAGFRPPAGARWRRLPGAPPGDEVVCHNDLAPPNTVFRAGLPVAFVDWDFAAPGPRTWDVAHAAWRFVALGAGGPVDEAARRLALFCAEYGLEERDGMVDLIARRQQVLHDTVRALAEAGDPAFVAMWGTEHSEGPLRDRAWLLAHRAAFEAALAAG